MREYLLIITSICLLNAVPCFAGDVADIQDTNDINYYKCAKTNSVYKLGVIRSSSFGIPSTNLYPEHQFFCFENNPRSCYTTYVPQGGQKTSLVKIRTTMFIMSMNSGWNIEFYCNQFGFADNIILVKSS